MFVFAVGVAIGFVIGLLVHRAFCGPNKKELEQLRYLREYHTQNIVLNNLFIDGKLGTRVSFDGGHKAYFLHLGEKGELLGCHEF